MTYTVLARKYRPQAFEEMTGQEHVVKTIENAIALNRVAHAYLFCGPRGVGKTTAARLLARALNCEKGPTHQPCGVCQACTEIRDGNSVDVTEIDGASNNGVENVREIRENAKYLPQRDRLKIYIIDEVHMLSQAAFNALLKTLEEPPPHVKFIFATTEAQKLPETILSRCQRHNFRRISSASMLKRLQDICVLEKLTLTPAALSLLVRQSEGGMRDALSLLDQVIAACGLAPTEAQVAEALGTIDRTLIGALASALVKRDAKTLLVHIDEIFNRGIDMHTLAEELVLELRNLFVAKTAGNAPEELAQSDRENLMTLAKEADAAQLARLFDIVHTSLWDIGRAAHPRLALEMALLKGIHLAPAGSLSDLVTRLEKMSAAVPGVAGGRSNPTPFRAEQGPPS
jgi:DNA polymerase III subunit gamma/tau